MTWASWDDQFTEMPVWDGVSYEARWHYIALVTYCCSAHRWNGQMSRRQAERVSDVPEPHDAVEELITAGLLAELGTQVELLYIDSHVPPEGQRPDNLLPRKRRNQMEYRRRQCERGNHSKDCPAKTCPAKHHGVTVSASAGSAPVPGTANVLTDRVTGNAGAGRDGAGRVTTTTKPRLDKGEDRVGTERPFPWELYEQ